MQWLHAADEMANQQSTWRRHASHRVTTDALLRDNNSSQLRTIFILNLFGVRSLNLGGIFPRGQEDKSCKMQTAEIANCVESSSFGKENSNLASSVLHSLSPWWPPNICLETGTYKQHKIIYSPGRVKKNPVYNTFLSMVLSAEARHLVTFPHFAFFFFVSYYSIDLHVSLQ